MPSLSESLFVITGKQISFCLNRRHSMWAEHGYKANLTVLKRAFHKLKRVFRTKSGL